MSENIKSSQNPCGNPDAPECRTFMHKTTQDYIDYRVGAREEKSEGSFTRLEGLDLYIDMAFLNINMMKNPKILSGSSMFGADALEINVSPMLNILRWEWSKETKLPCSYSPSCVNPFTGEYQGYEREEQHHVDAIQLGLDLSFGASSAESDQYDGRGYTARAGLRIGYLPKYDTYGFMLASGFAYRNMHFTPRDDEDEHATVLPERDFIGKGAYVKLTGLTFPIGDSWYPKLEVLAEFIPTDQGMAYLFGVSIPMTAGGVRVSSASDEKGKPPRR